MISSENMVTAFLITRIKQTLMSRDLSGSNNKLLDMQVDMSMIMIRCSSILVLLL